MDRVLRIMHVYEPAVSLYVLIHSCEGLPCLLEWMQAQGMNDCHT